MEWKRRVRNRPQTDQKKCHVDGNHRRLSEPTQRPLRRKRELAEKLAFAVEYGTEDEFVAAVKKFKPDVGEEELKGWIMRFHDARRAKRGL